MKLRLKVIISLFLLFSLFSCQTQPNYQAIRVSKVVDGDTIELENGEVIRYIGIDTPELTAKVGELWVDEPRLLAEEAWEFNRQLVEGKLLRLEFDVQRRDKYGRVLAYCFKDSLFINSELLKAGYALLYTIPPNVKYVEELLVSQREAMQNGRGLWKEGRIISSIEAEGFIGDIRRVEGRVLNVHRGEKAIHLNFGQDWRTDFTIVIFRDGLAPFSALGIQPEIYYKGKMVRVSGLIKQYNGPEIIVRHPSQIEIIEEVSEKP